MSETFQRVGIVGTGATSQDMAQLAVQSAANVRWYSDEPAALDAALKTLHTHWDKQVQEGKITSEAATAFKSRLTSVSALDELSNCGLLIEAVAQERQTRQQTLAQLNALAGPESVLVTTAVSQVTAAANGLERPQRLAGLHGLRNGDRVGVVEIVSGLHTDESLLSSLAGFARAATCYPVRVQNAPNSVAQQISNGIRSEALQIAAEQVTDFATIDRVLKDQLGWQQGPFEHMDDMGLDTVQQDMADLFGQYHGEPRHRPSHLVAQRVAGRRLGRKTGQGFYRYDTRDTPTEQPVPSVDTVPPIWVPPRAARRAEIYQLLKQLGATIETAQQPSAQALILVAPLGHDMTTVSAVERLDPTRTVGIDMLMPDNATRRRVLATTPATRPDMRDAAHALFARDGKAVSVIRDSGGFVCQRVVAHVVNVASDLCQQGICTPADLDAVTALSLGHPAGVLGLGDQIGPTSVLEILFNLQTVYGDARYRPSPWLRRRGALGLSLKHEEL